jgi:imidazolonepropionase
MTQQFTIWENMRAATMCRGFGRYGLINDAVIVTSDGHIESVQPRESFSPTSEAVIAERVDCGGRLATPGLIDCHTHLVFAGNRANEFEMLLDGKSYSEIASAGGGIQSTVRITRAGSEDVLLDLARRRVERMLADGVTTIEIKSGYGLETDTEAKLLRVARKLDALLPVSIHTTFLGAHALPPEYADHGDDYTTLVCEEMLPQIAAKSLADSVDAFRDDIGFNHEQVSRIFQKASQLRLPVRLHADQLTDANGAALAAEFHALSADHLEYTSEGGVRAMRNSGTVAVLLPGAFYYLGEKRKPPIDMFRRHMVPIAIATDMNPGSSPLNSLLIALNMGCVLFGLTPEEALNGVTVNAAKALGLNDECGTLEPGKRADIVFWEVESPAELCYAIGAAPPSCVVQAGRPVVGSLT